jgi:hypothetical protein
MFNILGEVGAELTVFVFRANYHKLDLPCATVNKLTLKIKKQVVQPTQTILL